MRRRHRGTPQIGRDILPANQLALYEMPYINRGAMVMGGMRGFHHDPSLMNNGRWADEQRRRGHGGRMGNFGPGYPYSRSFGMGGGNPYGGGGFGGGYGSYGGGYGGGGLGGCFPSRRHGRGRSHVSMPWTNGGGGGGSFRSPLAGGRRSHFSPLAQRRMKEPGVYAHRGMGGGGGMRTGMGMRGGRGGHRGHEDMYGYEDDFDSDFDPDEEYYGDEDGYDGMGGSIWEDDGYDDEDDYEMMRYGGRPRHGWGGGRREYFDD
ncbi:hypothetical protein EJ08DRAFT_656238 [Tothia fuscella]|uniref:Uncharacterized protein n=1 Tax=Tothia fuscella TaxID=1048955 RepID=A0A9P4P3E7_9PEZI|nr:hypothetical protein EJ08DRAFT_656238 [Tothia fuscella]